MFGTKRGRNTVVAAAAGGAGPSDPQQLDQPHAAQANFPFSAANEAIRNLMSKHPRILTHSLLDPDHLLRKDRAAAANDFSKPHLPPYMPLSSANSILEDAGTALGLIMQVELHAAVATVLVGFVFSALLSEGPSLLGIGI